MEKKIYEGGGMVEIDTGPSEIVEEFLEFPEDHILNQMNGNLVRMDMNIVEYPLFSKNKRRKINQTVIYYFNERKDKYIEIKPISGTTIPGEFEEKIFISLVKIMRKNGYGKNFVVTNSEILENMCVVNQGTKNALYHQVKGAMLKLTETSYTFKNSLYSNEMGGLIENAVITSIMNIQIISKKSARKGDKEYFKDGRINEIYKVSLSDHFYNNIIRKGYLVYDADLLLGINTSTARGIYLLITKWRFENLYLSLNILTLLKRIPLKHDSKNIGRSIKVIENACNELKEKKLIENFNFLKHKRLSETEIEFFFNDDHNQLKQDNFFVDKNAFNQILISSTEEKNIHENDRVEVTKEMIEEVFRNLPAKALELKTMEKTIVNSIKKYGFEKVKQASIYTKKNKALKIRNYFLQTLENNWSTEIEIMKENSPEIESTLKVEKACDSDMNLIQEKYNSLSEKQRQEIDAIIYKKYIEKCGMETDIQKRAFNFAKNSLILEYLKNAPEISDENYLNSEELKKEINTQLYYYGEFFDLDEDMIFSAKFEVGRVIFEKFGKNKVTLDNLLKVVKEVIKKIKK
ncbi:hypothetical protein H3N56_11750 [Cetobacterium sp. 2A]|uniref:hypothetical protein n=2 Tax=unclassified Cetobacterium TaxID=2630983 RepID=UPI00163C1CD1|nr:hypothetical protein [Cetobacterium sp. 2A]MBC2857107.1 hypothetical protein [Cetobacterium sp. 2A]